MNASVKPLEKSQVELTVSLPFSDIEPFLDRAATAISKQMNIKGFRPGKVPRNIVEQRVGMQMILEEALNIAMPRFYTDAVKKVELETLGMPRINVTKLAPDNDIEFTATITVMPKVELPNYRKLMDVKRTPVAIKDEDVEKTLDYLQKSRATHKEVDRAAASGDRATVDFVMKQGGVVLEDGTYTDHPINMGEKQIVAGFEDQLSGMKKGDKKSFSIIFPKEHFKKELAEKKVDFDVEMKKVEQVDMPKLDDTFAKGLGKFTSIAELRAKIKENLTHEEEYREQERLETEIVDKIAKETTVEIPEVLIESETNNMIAELNQTIASSGGKFEDYLTSIKKTVDQLKAEIRPQAEKRAKAGLVIREIAKQEELNAEAKEIEDEINKVLIQHMGNEQVKEQVTSPEFYDHVKSVIRNRKVLDLLTKKDQNKEEVKS